MVGVAQSVERRSVAAEAAGSKPVTHPRIKSITFGGAFYFD